MTNTSALEELLSGLVATKGFELDNRTIQTNLEFIEQYTQYIPYLSEVAQVSSDASLTWRSIFFTGEDNPAKLAEIYRNRALAGGTLWPQEALLLAFLEVLETPRALLNYLPFAHRELYYRQLLGLSERPAEPARVALSFLLSTKLTELLIPAGTLFPAGQDRQGAKIQYALDSDLLANQAQWTDLRWCWRPKADGVAKSFIAYEKPQQPWPETGLRLFSENDQDQDILIGRIVISSLLEEPGAEKFYVTFSQAITTQVVAQVSSGDHWLSLLFDKKDSSNTEFTFLLAPADVGAISAPMDLDGLTFELPVLRLACNDEEDQSGLPVIKQLGVNSTAVNNPQQYILTPFGYSTASQPVAEAQLYLGFSAIQPQQTLSLFWQLTGAKELSIVWQYLNSSNQWALLDATVIDETTGLFRSGLWSTILPSDASVSSPSMPSGRYWLRALMEDSGVSLSGVSDYPFVVGLVTNGMTATMQNPALLDPTILAQPLSADSISQPLTSIAGLSKTLQPWDSWGGRPQETTEAFFERSAQRLDHRNRVLTWQDMVAILKAGFKAVFDVAIPASINQTMVPAQRVQRLIVIPLNAEKDNADVLRPQLNQARLNEMANYLERLASPWQSIAVENPNYRDVRIVYEVRFHGWMNPDYGYRELRLALEQYYMPWAGSQVGGVKLANSLDYYDVVAQIQQQTYVDYVASLTLDGARKPIQGNDDEVLILVWPIEGGGNHLQGSADHE
ncbi:hypothetical protein SAMN05660489_04873 [Pseudomonas sp. LAMO17WK12:I10]|uniref:hypothetical protein n=1 Tax=unclassified Pseudomonas TaxID=196821 RepID=UPI000BD76696|nr:MULTISPECIES: hypothetical protein [unclassified Pseudomonas]PXX59075.1 hypothetical protein H160_04804 [Pseudomonas sp. LAMO17WK12:I9]SNY48400.1 hypothetical protein SAMN05660489_04873 [Pseudomonas sp. LAMO17WK12:I10]